MIGQEWRCPECENRTSRPLCASCGRCSACCDCADLFDADELGLDPEEDDERA